MQGALDVQAARDSVLVPEGDAAEKRQLLPSIDAVHPVLPWVFGQPPLLLTETTVGSLIAQRDSGDMYTDLQHTRVPVAAPDTAAVSVLYNEMGVPEGVLARLRDSALLSSVTASLFVMRNAAGRPELFDMTVRTLQAFVNTCVAGAAAAQGVMRFDFWGSVNGIKIAAALADAVNAMDVPVDTFAEVGADAFDSAVTQAVTQCLQTQQELRPVVPLTSTDAAQVAAMQVLADCAGSEAWHGALHHALRVRVEDPLLAEVQHRVASLDTANALYAQQGEARQLL